MKDKVLSVEQINHLKELGLEILNPSIFWVKNTVNFKGEKVDSEYKLSFSDKIIVQNFEHYEAVPTLTFDDIFEMLPKMIIENKETICKLKLWTNHKINSYSIVYEPTGGKSGGHIILHKFRLIDAAYEMLIWCLENSYINKNKN